jgi:succinate dehydrogenase / fumarate reductase flavoprotein subunit
LVGIVRTESEMVRAIEGIDKLKARAAKVGVTGHREYNPGWHTAIDLHNLMTVSEAIARAAVERKESRGAQFREDYPEKSAECAKFNILLRKGTDGQMQVIREPVKALPSELQQVVDENK